MSAVVGYLAKVEVLWPQNFRKLAILVVCSRSHREAVQVNDLTRNGTRSYDFGVESCSPSVFDVVDLSRLKE